MRDSVPHLGLIPKVIPLKLFLDMVPSSPADVSARCVDVLTCFFREDQKRNGRECFVKVACIHLYSKHTLKKKKRFQKINKIFTVFRVSL